VKKLPLHLHTWSGFYAINSNLWPAILLTSIVWKSIDHRRGASADLPSVCIHAAHARKIGRANTSARGHGADLNTV